MHRGTPQTTRCSRAARDESARVDREGIGRRRPGYGSRHGGVAVDAFERQVLAMGQRERESHDEDDEDRDHGAKKEWDDRSTLAQPAKRYARRARLDARS